MAHCPKCKSESRHRMRRVGIYKSFPATKAYSCDRCNTYYVWFNFLRKAIKVKF